MTPPSRDPAFLALAQVTVLLDDILTELRALRADLTTPPPPAAFLDVAEAAALLGASQDYVLKHTFDVTAPHERCQPYHEIPARLIGKGWRYHPDLLSQFVRGEYRRPDAPPVATLKRRSA